MSTKPFNNRVLFSALLAAASCTACADQAAVSDPFAWCAQQGDTEIIGGPLPGKLVSAMVAQGLVAEEAPPHVQQANDWRCMEGQVWVCPLGANLPCAEKADLSREPSQAVADWCQANAGADVPAYVTGRATVFSWKCDGTTAVIQRQVSAADPAGFLSAFWYPLEEPES